MYGAYGGMGGAYGQGFGAGAYTRTSLFSGLLAQLKSGKNLLAYVWILRAA